MSETATAVAEKMGEVVPYRDLPYAALDAISAIWGGMDGRILVMHTAWNPTSAKRIFAEESNEILDLHILDLTFNKMVKTDNLLFEGDVIAIDHIISQLRYLHNPRKIRVENSWTFADSSEELKENDELMGLLKNRHLVCIGGPRSNLVTDIVLRKAGLEWLYDEGTNSFRTRPDCDGKFGYEEKPISSVCTAITDHGIFVKCDNPYNEDKTMCVLMGIHCYGTQGAAALVCNAESANELVSITSGYEDLNAKVKIHNLACARVFRLARKDLSKFSPSKVTYQIAYPERGGNLRWTEHTNPRSIRGSQRRVKHSVTNPVFVLGSPPSRLVVHDFFLLLFVSSLACALAAKQGFLFYASVVLCILGVTGALSSFLSLLTASTRKELKVGK